MSARLYPTRLVSQDCRKASIRQGKWFSVAVPELAVSNESLLPHRAPIWIAHPSTFDNNGQYDVTGEAAETEVAECEKGP
jgi:hypothetical protein